MQNTARFNEHNSVSRTVATAFKRPWTRQDVEVARDRSRTVRDAASLLGRTMNTVKHMRRANNRKAAELMQ